MKLKFYSKKIKGGFLIILFALLGLSSYSQQSNLTPNVKTPLTNDRFGNLTVTSSSSLGSDEFANKDRIVDDDLTNHSKWTYLVAGSAWVEVKDNNAVNTDVYPAGSVAGFVLDNASIDVLGNTTITTFLGNTEQESVSGNGLLAISLTSNTGQLSFITTKDFDRIRISYTVLGLGSKSVYYAFVQKFEAGAEPGCNVNTQFAAPDYPVALNPAGTGVFGGLLSVGNVSHPENVIDGNESTYADITVPVGILNGYASIAVKDQLASYPAGTFAGFDISSASLINVGVVSSVAVRTFLNGVQQESKSGSGLLASVGLLSADGRNVVGFVTTKDFDEIRLVITSGVASVNLDETRVYSPVIKRFCAGDPLECNTPTRLTAPDYPVYVDGANTGITGGVSAGSISNWNNAIDNISDNYATIYQTANVLSTASFTIGIGTGTYPENTYAGIDISTETLLNAIALDYFKIQLLRNGTVVQESTSASLLVNVNTALLTGTALQTIGLVSNVDFDAVKLQINKPVEADLGVVRVYGATFETLCAVPILCNQSTIFEFGTHPVIINDIHTGVLGTVNIGSDVKSPDHVLTPNASDYAEITTVAGVLSNASLSVVNPIQEYPTGTFAGFTVQNINGLIDLNLLKSFRIKTYLNGQLQEVRSGNTLLELTLLTPIFSQGSNTKNIGFETTKPFDEIQISVGELVSAATHLRIYGSFIDTRTARGIDGGGICSVTVPDFVVTNIGVPVSGDVSTNDNVPEGTTYGTPEDNPNNPSTEKPNMNEDGTFTFVTNTPGRYVFDVPYCFVDQTENCATETLVVTVKRTNTDDDNLNNPVANDDQASVKGSDDAPSPITINVKANDEPGNIGGELGDPTIENAPQNGITSIDASGNAVYTPNAEFYGVDEFSYKICETPSGKCETAIVRVTVYAEDMWNTTTVVDDYASTLQNHPLTKDKEHGVLANDVDAEGNAQIANGKTEIIKGAGTLELNSDGSYTFTSVDGFYGPLSFIYTVTDNGAPMASDTGTLHILVEQFETVPDFAVTNINVRVDGDVSTNDIVPTGTTYGNPADNLNNPSVDKPEVNEDGSFTFVTGTPGRYEFDVPACPPGQVQGCPTETLVITTLDPQPDAANPNAPVANNDQAKTNGSMANPGAVTINVRANDKAGNPDGELGKPTIENAPANGSASVDGNGNVTYTPNNGFFGVDEFTYEVCESPSEKCATATVRVTVQEPSWINTTTAVDDYVYATGDEILNVDAVNGVLANDTDAEGNVQTATPQTTVIAGKGTLKLAADGSYTFTPEVGFSGPVSFSYEVKDNGNPQAAGYATLHILAGKSSRVADLTPTIWMDGNIFGEEQSRDFVVNIFNVGENVTDGTEISFTLVKPSGWNISWPTNNAIMDVNGGINVSNEDWDITQTSTLIFVKSKNPTFLNNDASSLQIGFNATRKSTTQKNANQNISVGIDNRSGGENFIENNNVFWGVVTR